MPLPKQKIIQSFISAFNIEARKIESARIQLNNYKAKYQNLNPGLTDTNLTPADVQAMNNYLNTLNTLCNQGIVSTIESKDIPSHDTKGLD